MLPIRLPDTQQRKRSEKIQQQQIHRWYISQVQFYKSAIIEKEHDDGDVVYYIERIFFLYMNNIDIQCGKLRCIDPKQR